MLRKILVSTVALSLAAGSAALAQSAGDSPKGPERTERGPNRIFDRLDADGNGTIGTEEFGGVRLEMLGAADEDSNGTLSQEEIADYLMKRKFMRKAERTARMLDVDGDGTVTLAEIEDHRGKRFALLDRNNDGEISSDEMRRGGFGPRAMNEWGRGDGGSRFAMRRGGDAQHHRFMKRMHRMEPAAQATPAAEAPTEE